MESIRVPAEADKVGRPAWWAGDRVRRPAYRLNRSFGRVTAVLGCLVLACTSCAGAGGEATVIQQVDLVGDWGNAAGARVHVAADHSLTASGINHAVPDFRCSTRMTAGRWRFYVQDGSPQTFTASDSATEGESFTVAADIASSTGELCDLEAQVHRDDQGFNICLVMDPDQNCTAEELLRKASTRPR